MHYNRHMKYKMIVSDLDGTLLPIGHTSPSPFALAVLKKARNQGILITIATGRGITGVPKELSDEGLIDYIIACNGSIVYDFRNKKVLFSRALDHKLTVDIIKKIKQEGIYVATYIDGNEIGDKEDLKRYDEFFINKEVSQMMLSVIYDIKDNLLDFIINSHPNVNKILSFFNDEELDIRDKLMKEIKKEYSGIDISSAIYNNMEITDDSSTKGQGLSCLCRHLKMDLAETVVLGDGDNDISMLKIAGLSIAPANGSANARKHAMIIADKVENDGVIKAIEEYVL